MIGASELLISCPSTRTSRCHAAPLLVAQRAADVAQHEQAMWTSLLAEHAAPDLPACRAPAEQPVDDARCIACQRLGEIQVGGGSAEASFGGAAQQALSRPIHEAQRVVLVEGEHRDVDLCHDGAQERGGLERAQALALQHVGQRVQFVGHVSERVAAPSGPGPERVVFLAQRRQQVGDRLQRPLHGSSRDDRAAESRQRRSRRRA